MPKMKFVATLNGKEHEIEVDNLGADDGVYNMRIDGGDVHKVDAQALKSNIVSSIIDNHSYDIDVERVGDKKDTLDGRHAIRVRGRVVNLEILDERRKKMKEAQASRFAVGGTAEIKSPMPGKIINFLVAPGDAVEEGQGIVVVEAMKMENELRAPKAGVVARLHGKSGEAVESGTVLAVIEDPSDDED